MKKIYLASHGELSEGIKDSLRLIAGETANTITTYSLTPGNTTQDFVDKIEKTIKESPQDQYILLGDLYGASVVNTLYSLTKYPQVILISGVNLALALQILLDTSPQLTEETVDKMIQNAKDGMKRLIANTDSSNEDNEF